MVAGEITTGAKLDYDKVVRGVVAQIGFDSFVDDLSSVDSKGLSHKTCPLAAAQSMLAKSQRAPKSHTLNPEARFSSASTNRARTLPAECMSARTRWMWELGTKESCSVMPAMRLRIACR